ncbi:YdcP family protein [Priestia sp. WB3]|uniref:YdcP family protein n=1 Tax=Bacillus pumilus TaxID=1408 RepID=UPI001C211EF9|nr:YdcP family protein [Bacillus pumilus]MBU8576663.1 YdcP family protein [Bacillus pumilus]
MELKFIVPNITETFGEIKFMGLNRDRFVFDRVANKRTDQLESRTYNLGSSCQGGQIEVTLPAAVELKEFDFMSDVELVNPIIQAQARANGNFANVSWTVVVDDIILKGSNVNASKVTPAAPATNEKK